MSSIKNVIIVGAGGNLGPAILKAFLNSSFNTTVLSREGSTSTFPSGVKVIRANYESVDSLTKAFEGQDAVVSLVAGHVIGDQNKLIDAAIAAGVKRFLPSEYGCNTPDARARAIVPVFEAKVATVDYLKSKEKEISWTSIITGPFFDWGLKVGFLGFNAADKSVTLFDNGATTFTATNLSTIGQAVVKSLERADLTKNQYVYTSSYQTTQKQVLEAAEKVTGAKWTVNNTTAAAAIEEGRAKVAKGDFSGFGNLILGVTYGPDQLCDHSPLGLWTEKLGLKEVDLETAVKKGLEGKLVDE